MSLNGRRMVRVRVRVPNGGTLDADVDAVDWAAFYGVEERPQWRYVVVVSPRGDVVRLDDRWTEYDDPRTLFTVATSGRLDDGTKVTVHGSHVALVWREQNR